MIHTLIIPGLYGSELQHWQTWIQHRIPNAVRVEQPEWDNPALPLWRGSVIGYMDRLPGKLWLLAHSFGCLAGIAAAMERPERIVGAMLVAPADPARFNANGFRSGSPYIAAAYSIASLLPQHSLPFPSVVVTSSNDPWMSLETAAAWAERWESRLINIGAAGHINVESGFGPWPAGLELFRQLQQATSYLLQGNINETPIIKPLLGETIL